LYMGCDIKKVEELLKGNNVLYHIRELYKFRECELDNFDPPNHPHVKITFVTPTDDDNLARDSMVIPRKLAKGLEKGLAELLSSGSS